MFATAKRKKMGGNTILIVAYFNVLYFNYFPKEENREMNYSSHDIKMSSRFNLMPNVMNVIFY